MIVRPMTAARVCLMLPHPACRRPKQFSSFERLGRPGKQDQENRQRARNSKGRDQVYQLGGFLIIITILWRSRQCRTRKPNIILLVKIHGYGILALRRRRGRGMHPHFDRLAADRDDLFSLVMQPSCTRRAAMVTGRIPNRSGMTCGGSGSGGRLIAERSDLGLWVLKQALRTFFTGYWHMGKADYALPNARAMTR